MSLGGRVSPWRSAVEEGRSPLGRFRKPEPCFPRTYATWDAKKDENRFGSVKFRLEAQPEPQCALDSLHHCRVSSVSRRRLVGPNTSSSSVVAFGVKGNCPALTIALRCPNRRPGASFQGCLSQIRLWGGTAPLRYRSSTILPLYHHHSNMLAGRCIHRCSQNRLG